MVNNIKNLMNVALFESISPDDIHTLLRAMSAKQKVFSANESVFLAGDRATHVGIVLSGQVHVVTEDFYGNRNILANIESGELFGEAFVCAGAAVLPVSVFAAKTSEILLIDFKKLFHSNHETNKSEQTIISNMLRITANRNLMLNQKIQFISKRTTKEKLLEYLSAQAAKANSNSFEIPFNRQELADFLSVDRSAMSAELCKLRDTGMLKFKKNRFVLIKK